MVLMFFVKSHVPARWFTEFKISSNIHIAFEVNLRKEKSILEPTYKGPSQDNKYFLLHLTNLLEHYSTHYEKVLILLHFTNFTFKLEVNNEVMKDLLQEHT